MPSGMTASMSSYGDIFEVVGPSLRGPCTLCWKCCWMRASKSMRQSAAHAEHLQYLKGLSLGPYDKCQAATAHNGRTWERYTEHLAIGPDLTALWSMRPAAFMSRSLHAQSLSASSMSFASRKRLCLQLRQASRSPYWSLSRNQGPQ